MAKKKKHIPGNYTRDLLRSTNMLEETTPRMERELDPFSVEEAAAHIQALPKILVLPFGRPESAAMQYGGGFQELKDSDVQPTSPFPDGFVLEVPLLLADDEEEGRIGTALVVSLIRLGSEHGYTAPWMLVSYVKQRENGNISWCFDIRAYLHKETVWGWISELQDLETAPYLAGAVFFPDGADAQKYNNEKSQHKLLHEAAMAISTILGHSLYPLCKPGGKVEFAVKGGKGKKSKKKAWAFDDYHVVRICPEKEAKDKAEIRKRNARPPREHERRGHWRTYKSGKKGWVNSATINPGVGGKITKDYVVEKGESDHG